MGQHSVLPQSWIEYNEETAKYVTVIGCDTFEANGLWQAVGNLIKLSYLFSLEYNLWVLPFWDLLGRLFFHLPPYASNLEIKSALKDITKSLVPAPAVTPLKANESAALETPTSASTSASQPASQ